MHVLLTGESEGYYEDFQDATGLLATCLRDGFAYQGQVSPHLQRPRGEPSGHLPTTDFVMCLQNHDQIGNRAMGDRLTTLADPAKLRAATALLLLSPFIPMLFMGEENGATSPFLFFTSHNDELAGLIREGRRSEFKHFAAFQDPARRDAIPDPNSPATFEASLPNSGDTGTAVFIRSLLDIRRDHIVPGLPGCRSEGVEVLGNGALRAAWRLGNGGRLLIGLNLGDAPVPSGLPDTTPLAAVPSDAAGAMLPPGSLVAYLLPA